MNTKFKNLLKEFKDYQFSTGTRPGDDYKTFERKYRTALRSLAKELNGELASFNKNHYCFSAFIERDGKYVYISISDVRYFPEEWHNNILIREAESDEDFSGGMNEYTDFENIKNDIENLLR